MSYDLLVFDPAHAPRERDAFLAWWDAQSEWSEPHDYDDPKVSTPALRAWFMDMIAAWPAMNGPYAHDDDVDDSAVSDYSVGSMAIYVAFAWSRCEEARTKFMALAAKHGLGVFEASSADAPVWWPDGRGGLAILHHEAADPVGDALAASDFAAVAQLTGRSLDDIAQVVADVAASCLDGYEVETVEDEGVIRVMYFRTVREVVADARIEMTLDEARSIDPDAELDDSLGTEVAYLAAHTDAEVYASLPGHGNILPTLVHVLTSVTPNDDAG